MILWSLTYKLFYIPLSCFLFCVISSQLTSNTVSVSMVTHTQTHTYTHKTLLNKPLPNWKSKQCFIFPQSEGKQIWLEFATLIFLLLQYLIAKYIVAVIVHLQERDINDTNNFQTFACITSAKIPLNKVSHIAESMRVGMRREDNFGDLMYHNSEMYYRSLKDTLNGLSLG